MRLTAVRNHLRFGNLAKIRGIVYYRLSPFEQKAFGGVISHGVPNIIRRMREQVLRVVPPFFISYFVYSWATQEHERFVRKKPGEFDNDV
ncbi:cytochrome b-c1 complex subunit 8 [Chelonus insularis]|uniref:cytochrome b-c1 complex subunit 8 n=1 Tax=Chelonus insularis TaxID=460826 RepID=UPI001588B550|nr:cytochrome b-c1 complex subunit 8 [Chelonus insularis]XP_034936212.1 cytochrome b-c1 complex subunit 8 [Chelonus insularis]